MANTILNFHFDYLHPSLMVLMVVLVVAMKGVMGVARMVDLKQLGVGWLVGVLGRLENKKPRL